MPYHSAWEAEAAAAASMQSNDQVYLHTRSKTATINNKKQRRIEREQWIVSRECGIKQKKTMTNGATRTKHRRWQAMPCGNDWFYCGSYGAWRPGTIIKLHVYMHVCMHASSSNDPSIHPSINHHHHHHQQQQQQQQQQQNTTTYQLDERLVVILWFSTAVAVGRHFCIVEREACSAPWNWFNSEDAVPVW